MEDTRYLVYDLEEHLLKPTHELIYDKCNVNLINELGSEEEEKT